MSIERPSTKSDSYSALLWDVVSNAHWYVPEPGDKVLDFGAHFGMFSLYCATRGAHVLAYEPTPATFGELIYTSAVALDASIEHGGGIEPINAAVSSKTGVANFHTNKVSTGNNSLLDRENTGIIFEVQTVSLHDALRGKMWDCVKVDIEGAEHDVFMNASSEDLKLIRFLTMEIHNDLLPEQARRELVARLKPEFPYTREIFVKRHGLPTADVATLLCVRHSR